MITDEATNRAMLRLTSNPDFILFMQMLREEEDRSMSALLSSTNTPLVHQLQGSSRVLVDIRQTVMSAIPQR